MASTRQIKAVAPLRERVCAMYGEYSVLNRTGRNIYVLKEDGTKSLLKATEEVSSVNAVQVSMRGVVGITYSEIRSHEFDFPGQLHTIPYVEIDTPNGFYFRYLNCVFVTEQYLESAKHPNWGVSFSELLRSDDPRLGSIASLYAQGTNTFAITINDPKNKFDKLYTMINGVVTPLKVVHNPGMAEITITRNTNDGTIVTEAVYIHPFLYEDEHTYLELNDFLPFIAKTPEGVEIYCKEHNIVSSKEMERIVNNIKDDTTRRVTEMKNSHEVDILAKNNRIKELEEDLRLRDRQISELTIRLQQLQAALDTTITMREHEYREAKLDAEQKISENKVDISENDVIINEAKKDSAEQERRYKLSTLAAGAALPIVGAAAAVLVKNKNNVVPAYSATSKAILSKATSKGASRLYSPGVTSILKDTTAIGARKVTSSVVKQASTSAVKSVVQSGVKAGVGSFIKGAGKVIAKAAVACLPFLSMLL